MTGRLEARTDLPLPTEITDDLNTSKFFHKIRNPKYKLTDIDFNALMVMGIISTAGYKRFLDREKDAVPPINFVNDVHQCVKLLMQQLGPAGVIAFCEHPQTRLQYTFEKDEHGYSMTYNWNMQFGGSFDNKQILDGMKAAEYAQLALRTPERTEK